ncbi:Flavodoxin [Cetobacterium ceti]|uniref:Flavodoxin n=1 Tax=Cetobacterium ceti TaxID=180163 RepID=A0A1T4NDE9_9FUSO|nr:flavodoxin family protein [Cetobacterium ceti]SJZ77254.1 Flavodoxin [Cetobacterium ceti]
MKKTALIYSSLTGNTKKIGDAIFEIIPGDKSIYSIEEAKELSFEEYDRIIVGFWVDKGHADSRVKKLINRLKNKEIAFFGTLGAEPDSDHGRKVYTKVSELCSKNNNLIGGFLSLGKVSDKLVEMMKKFPLNLIHPLTPERKARIEKASTHPDENDLNDAKNYFISILN